MGNLVWKRSSVFGYLTLALLRISMCGGCSQISLDGIDGTETLARSPIDIRIQLQRFPRE